MENVLNRPLTQIAISPDVLNLIPKEFMETHGILPFDFSSTGVLCIATSLYEQTIQNLSIITETLRKQHPEINGIKVYQVEDKNFQEGFLTHLHSAFIMKTNNIDVAENEIVASSQQEQIFNDILKSAIEKKASDIHIIPSKDSTVIAFRINGVFTPQVFPVSITDEIAISNLFKNKAKMTLNNLQPEDGQLIFGNDIEMRINTMPYGKNTNRNIICARIIGTNAGIRSLEDLGFSDKETVLLRRIASKPSGIFLICGPTSEGKSTTLYSLLKEIQINHNCKIITVENPIEKYLGGVAQSETRDAKENKYTFGDALRACLRQDPDVIMVGEIRDAETAQIANIASQTGHLIFSTLHVLNSIGVFQRLSDMGANQKGFAEQVIGIASQRLIPVLCPHCKQEVISPKNSELRKQDLDKLNEGKSFISVGCDKCGHTGISGRIPIIEIIEFNNYLKDFFRQEHGLIDTEKFLRKNTNFVSLWDKGFEQVVKGNVSLEELLNVITVDEDLNQYTEVEK